VDRDALLIIRVKKIKNNDSINKYVCLVIKNMTSWPIWSGKARASSGKKKNIEQGPLVRTPELNEKLEYREHSFRSKAAWL
jgi:hypothetical protein